MGTEKRERQKAARLDKISAQATAAKRDRTRGTAIRIAVAAVVVLGVLFGVSQLMGDDDSDTETSSGDETSTTLGPTDTTTPEYTNPDLAEQVLAREPPAAAAAAGRHAGRGARVDHPHRGRGRGRAAPATSSPSTTSACCPTAPSSTSRGRRGSPSPSQIGTGQVIPGWDEGLIGVKVGERRHLVIGADNAYGAAGSGSIPPNAPLAFDVDVVDIQPAAG